jgi:hypothetical protein
VAPPHAASAVAASPSTPVHGTSIAGLTPVPGATSSLPHAAGPVLPAPLPAPGATSAPSAGLSTAAPIPRHWIKLGAIAIAGAVLVALVAVWFSGDSDRAPERAAAASAPAVPPMVASPVAPKIDNETQLKALLHDLESGKTCEERKAVIPKLVELGDKAAIPHLRKARYRKRGGVLGIGESNANACLKAAAEAAIEKLGK